MAVPVVNPSQLCLVAEPVDDFYLLYHICRHIAECCDDVVSEKLLSVKQDTGHFLAVSLYAGIRNRDSGHLGYKTLGICIFYDLICCCVEDKCIALLL